MAFCPTCNFEDPEPPFCRCGFDVRHGLNAGFADGRCIYCKSGGLTREHIYGDWARRRYLKKERRLHLLRRPKSLDYFAKIEMVDRLRPMHTAERYGETITNVCGGCNKGWMKTTLDDALGTIQRAAENRHFRASDNEKIALAKWSAVTTVSQAHWANTPTMHQAKLDMIRAGEMPPGWRVWVGSLPSDEWGGASRYYVGCPYGMEPNGGLEFHLSYFIIERLAVVTLGAFGEGALDLLAAVSLVSEHTISAVRGLRRIWPLAPDPPPALLDRYALDLLIPE